MKLLLCKKCQDVFKLTKTKRFCQCGECSGKYVNRNDVVYSGEFAVLIGFNNRELVAAVINQPKESPGKEFTAFVIPKNAKSVKKIKNHLFS
jgi:hypothetical protein